MSMDDCFIPTRSLPHECAPPLSASWASHPCLSQLDLGERAAAHSGKPVWGGSHGEAAVCRRTLQILNRPVAVPPRRSMAPLGPMPKISRQLPHLQRPSLYMMFREDLPDEPKQHHASPLPDEPKQQHASRVVASRAAPRGRTRSRAGWASKERSTPEDINLEQHAFRFQFSFPDNRTGFYDFVSGPDSQPPAPRKKKPLEERNALREKRIAQMKRASEFHARLALSKYNKSNNTKFEFVEVRASCLFFEFGGGCYHYNFIAKPEEGAQDGSSGDEKLFFSEVAAITTSLPKDEKDVLHCCILVKDDKGDCYGCKGEKPVVVHPTSRAYGGGSSTCIARPGSLSDSDSD